MWGAVWCGVMCGAVWCGDVWCRAVWCGVVWCDVLGTHPVRSLSDTALSPSVLVAAQRDNSLSLSVDGTTPRDATLETVPSSDFGRKGQCVPHNAAWGAQHTFTQCNHSHTLGSAHITLQCCITTGQMLLLVVFEIPSFGQ